MALSFSFTIDNPKRSLNFLPLYATLSFAGGHAREHKSICSILIDQNLRLMTHAHSILETYTQVDPCKGAPTPPPRLPGIIVRNIHIEAICERHTAIEQLTSNN